MKKCQPFKEQFAFLNTSCSSYLPHAERNRSYSYFTYLSNSFVDATVIILLTISINSTCFGRYFRPSSGALDCVYILSYKVYTMHQEYARHSCACQLIPTPGLTGRNTSPLNTLRAELNPIRHLLALLGAHHIFHVSGLRVKLVASS